MQKKIQVAIVMGSVSDLKTMEASIKLLSQWKISTEVKILSAHRSPDIMQKYGLQAIERGIQVIIAGAGGAAHLPGMLASNTVIPVIGVPISLKNLKGLDSLLSVVQMPKGVVVATVAIDNSYNAALLALQILSIQNSTLQKKLLKYRKKQKNESVKSNKLLKAFLSKI